jgi:hypothetical protein
MEPLKISLRKGKLAGLLLLILTLLIPVGYWALTVEVSVLAAEGRSSFLVRSIGALLVFSGALLVAVSLPRLISSAPALVLDETGLSDNTTILGNGHIPWSDIREFHFGEAEHQRLLFVIVDQPHQYLGNKSGLTRMLARARERRGDPSPFSIPTKHLAISESELSEHLTRYASAWHARTAQADRSSDRH